MTVWLDAQQEWKRHSKAHASAIALDPLDVEDLGRVRAYHRAYLTNGALYTGPSIEDALDVAKFYASRNNVTVAVSYSKGPRGGRVSGHIYVEPED